MSSTRSTGESGSGERPLMHLLSQAYVAFTIEFDNGWEGRLINRGIAPSFLVSYMLWANCMRYVPPGDGISRTELEERCSVWNGPIHLGRMEEWWGYLQTTDGVVRPSVAGVMALESWAGLAEEVHEAWTQRLGPERMGALVGSLTVIERGNDLDLPDTMPALAYNDGYRTPKPESGPGSPADAPTANVGALLARVLLAATLTIEEDAAVPAAAAVFLSALGPDASKVKELATATAVRKEAVTPAITNLSKWGLIAVEGKGAQMTAALTPDGLAALDEHRGRMGEVDKDWRARHGSAVVDDLRSALTSLHDQGSSGRPLLAEGLEPPAKGWRASKAYRAQTDLMLTDPAAGLPVHPMLTHRGAWPDGA